MSKSQVIHHFVGDEISIENLAAVSKYTELANIAAEQLEEETSREEMEKFIADIDDDDLYDPGLDFEEEEYA